MKINMIAYALAVFGALTVVPAQADELLLGSNNATKAGSQEVSLDLLAEGKATGIEIRVQIPGGKAMRVDTSKCAKNPPKTHNASCVFNGQEVVVLLYSATNASLPAGMLNLGSFSIQSKGRAAGNAAPKVTSFIAAAADGTTVATKTHSVTE